MTGVVAGYREVPPISMPCAIAGHGPQIVGRELAGPLEINALLLKDGGERCLLISFDLLFVGGDLEREIRTALAARRAFTDSDVFLFASHTHFAPPTDRSLPALGPCDAAYSARIVATVLELVDELIARAPRRCSLELRQRKLSHSVNRRLPRRLPFYTRTTGLSFERVVLGANPAGPHDETASLISLTDVVTREEVAVIWHYACHPVSCSPGDVVSADFPGAVRATLRRGLKVSLPVIFLQGFAGDIRPNIAARPPSGLRQRIRKVVREVVGGIQSMETTPAAWRDWVGSLGDRMGELAAATPVGSSELQGFARAWGTVPLCAFFDGGTRIDSMRVSALRLGRAVEIFALGAEPCVNWQRTITEAIGPPNGVRLYTGYCGDAFGYLPLPEQVDEGGYEVRGFQKLFGMAGRFRKDSLRSTVTAAAVSVVGALQ